MGKDDGGVVSPAAPSVSSVVPTNQSPRHDDATTTYCHSEEKEEEE